MFQKKKNESRRSQQIGLLSKLGPANKPYEIPRE